MTIKGEFTRGNYLRAPLLHLRGKFYGLGRGGGVGGWGDQNRRTDFENSVIRPVFHR